METLATLIFDAVIYLVVGVIVALVVGLVHFAQGQPMPWPLARKQALLWPLVLLTLLASRLLRLMDQTPREQKDKSLWRPWFAWRPILVNANTMTWWVWIERRPLSSHYDMGTMWHGWEYMIRPEPDGWRPWFAWRPVRLWQTGELVWWRPLERVMDWPAGGFGSPIRYETKYRPFTQPLDG